MARFRVNCSPIGSFLLVFIMIISFTLLLGQGLGRLYLGNITREVVNEEYFKGSITSSRGGSISGEINAKTKVLRLNQVGYYSILVTTVEERQSALQIGKELGQKGLPVIVTGEKPSRILLGLVNNEASLLDLADKIKVGEENATVSKDYLNKVAFKFAAEDTFAAEKIAPFLGELSLCLEKGLLLYRSIEVNEEKLLPLRPKFSELANSLEDVAKEGKLISLESKEEMVETLGLLSELCVKWSQSLRDVESEWNNLSLLKSQQQGLVLIEEYHRYIKLTN